MTSHPEDSTGTAGVDGVAGVLTRMQRRVQELTDTLWAARDSVELMDAVAALEALRSSLDGLELSMVRELEDTQAVKPVGWASTQDFVTAVAGGHKGAGPAVVRLGQAVATPLFTPVGKAMNDGWLSTAKAHVILRAIDHLPGDGDIRRRGVEAMLEAARGLDATELRKVGTRLVSIVDPEGEAAVEEKELDREERAAHLGRELSVSFDGAGGCWIKGRCSAEDGTKLRTTLMPLARPQPATGPVCDPASCDVPGCGHDGRDPRDHGARMLDALVQLCDQAAGAGLLPECHGVSPRVSVTIELESLRSQSGLGVTETGEDLSAGAVRRMACDAEIIPVVLGTDSMVLDVGHTQRLVTPAIWRALVARDRHCRFPHCCRPPVMTHAHHLVHWADGGPTSLQNLILLCGHHHRLVHAGPWGIRRAGPDLFAFDPPPGVRRITSAGREPPDG